MVNRLTLALLILGITYQSEIAAQTTPPNSSSALTASGSTRVASRASGPKAEKQSTSKEAIAESRKLYKMGVKYGRAKLFKQAAESFRKAVQLDPNFGDAHYGLGHAYFDLGQWQDAIYSLERALQINSKDSDALAMLGEAHLMLKGEKEATTQTDSSPLLREQNQPAGALVSLSSDSSRPSNANIELTKTDFELTRIYRVGAGDVLDVRIADDPGGRSTLFTVTPSGLLEHPALSDPLPVVGLTVEEIGNRLEEDLKRRAISDKPKVTVGVRDYLSHAVLVSGLVKEPGTKILRREAIPLYVVLADAQPLAEAGRVSVVRHETNQVLDLDLTEPREMNLLVKPGDVISIQANPTQFFYLGGEVKEPGEKSFRRGMTLTQAILAAGGPTNNAKEARVGRDNGSGFLEMTKYNLKDINSGKLKDPLLQPGDRITIVD